MIVVDAHCDTLLKVDNESGLYDLGNRAHLDIKRLKNKVDLQLFAVFIESCFKPYQPLQRGLELIEIFHRELEKNKSHMALITNKEDLVQVGQLDKVHALLTVEGGEILCGKTALLHILFRLGVRSIGLTWNQRNDIADGCGEALTCSSLTNFGIEVIKEMNLLGMIIDLAHISERGFWAVLEHTRQPVMVSHGNCQKICNHVRNLTDSQIRALKENNGVMGITFVPAFLSGERSSSEDVLRHIDHAASLVGADHIGLGSDFDGTDTLPEGLDNVCQVFALANNLSKRGYSNDDIEKIMGKNFLRLFYDVLPT